jgi:hypothetical protein
LTEALISRSKDFRDRRGASSSGVIIHGPRLVAVSLALTGPRVWSTSRACRSRALQSQKSRYPAMCCSASSGDRLAPPRPMTAANSSSKSYLTDPGGIGTSSRADRIAAGFWK